MSLFTILKAEDPGWRSAVVPTLVEAVVDEDLMLVIEVRPDWLDRELCEVGLDAVFLHWVGWEEQALVEGLCPGQRVLLLVHPPDYRGEDDVDYEWRFFWKEPLSPEVHAERWLNWLEWGQDEEYLNRLHVFMQTLALAKEV